MRHPQTTYLKEQHSTCDYFNIYTCDDEDTVIAYRSRFSGETLFIGINVNSELAAWALVPLRRADFIFKCSEVGFQISPLPGAVESFLHLLKYPEDGSNTFKPIHIGVLPKDAVVTKISTLDFEETDHA